MPRFAVSLTLLFTCVAAMAGAPATDRGLILSFEELRALSPSQREQYVQDLTEVIIALEKAQTNYEVAQSFQFEDIKEYIAFLQSGALLPQAHADAPLPANIPRFDPKAGPVCEGTGLVFDPRVGTCLILRKDKDKQTVDFGSLPCPDQSVQIAGYEKSTKLCIEKDSWKNLPPARQNEVRTGRFLSPDAFKGLSRADAEKLIGKVGDVSAVNKAATAAATPAPTPAPQSPPAHLCGTEKLACSSLSKPEKAALIAKFRADKTDNVCIYGGNFSRYQVSKRDPKQWKKAGTCDPVRQYRGSEPCAVGKVLCNPILFCVAGVDPTDHEVKPARICERTGSNATVRCQAAFNKMKAEKDHHVCDIEKDFPGKQAQESWSKLTKDVEAKYQKYCHGDLNFQALFCEECKIIGEQLIAMNAKVRPECGPSDHKPEDKKPTNPAAVGEKDS